MGMTKTPSPKCINPDVISDNPAKVRQDAADRAWAAERAVKVARAAEHAARLVTRAAERAEAAAAAAVKVAEEVERAAERAWAEAETWAEGAEAV